MYPFRDGDTHATFQNILEKAKAEIGALENDYILKASPAELEQYFLSNVLITALILDEKQRAIEGQVGADIDISGDFRRGFLRGERASVRGTRLDIAIPYQGDKFLWKVRASTWSMSGYPDITVHDDRIVFSVSFPDDSVSPDQIRSEVDRHVKSLVEAVNYQRSDVDNHNRTAPDVIRQAIERKRKLAESTGGAIAALGIPLKRKNAEPAFALPVKRRETPTRRPSVGPEKFDSEPYLEKKEYEHILEVLRSMCLVIERSPSAFTSLDEEGIRNHFLIQLNGHYEGGATGETFNAAGKTDILIREGNRNVFIAECKFWRGPSGFNEAVDQLLGYLSWRDSKCALLVFNKTLDTSSVRQKMHEVLEARSEHRKTVRHEPNRDSQYILVKASDPGREITVTTQVYDLPVKK